MKKVALILILISNCFMQACKSNNSNAAHAVKTTADISMLDSIKKNADTIYSKNYPRTDLVTADYYINHKDSTITQVMRDRKGTIRQVIIAKNKIRTYFATFYSNGQLVATYNLDHFGQYNDSSKEFFENGVLKSEGVYKNGFHSGKWKNYDSTGKYLNTDEYNNDGLKVKTVE